MAAKPRPNKTIADAIAHHQAGRLDDALALCEKALKRNSSQADALHLKGIITFQKGDAQAALEILDAAITAAPKNAAYHNSRGLVLKAQGRRDDAVETFERVIGLAPRFALAYCRLGQVLDTRGEHDAALALFREAQTLAPNDAGIAQALARAEARPKGGGGPSAASVHRRGATDSPETLQACLRLVGRKDKVPALVAFRRLIAEFPDHAESHRRFGDLLLGLGRCEEAVVAYRRALTFNPVDADAQTNLGVALHQLGRFEEACAAFDTALDLAPGSVAAYYNLGCALSDLGRHAQAVEQFARATAREPDHASAHWNSSSSLLALGHFKEGWAEYEWRFQSSSVLDQIGRRHFDAPRWDGSPLDGGRVFIHCEQGVGDVIQMARYLPQIIERGARPVLECQPELARLLGTSLDGIAEVVARRDDGAVRAAHDCYLPVMSLPGLFETTLETIPQTVPYISAPAALAEHWAARLAGQGLAVGLVWAGRPAHRNDRRRSCRLADFAPLAAVSGVRFFALQKGDAAAQATQPPDGLAIESLDSELDDFADTAGAVANLDLVISVDTAVVHLAGAMGRPVWTLLPQVADWRWLIEREDSPWYPSMRLVRQSNALGRPELMTRLSTELAAFAAAP
jgi:tetratricopeptide (TPR) repeat protein